MVRKASDLDFDALAKLAKAATAEGRAKAVREDGTLPVWSRGRVVQLPIPKVGHLKSVEDPFKAKNTARKSEGASIAGRSGKHLHRDSND